MIGTKLGPYEITGNLGEGGMGKVYKARDTRLDRNVAIKVLPDEVGSDPDRRQRFEREARAVAALSHPNICAIFDVGYEGGVSSGAAPGVDYLVMEYLEGETLAARLERGGLSSVGETLRIATQLALALAAAHKAGIIHRDLKPGNIMLTRSGVKVLDFGLARLVGQGSASMPGLTAVTVTTPLTGMGTLLGTMPYMSPEQVEGKAVDARSDIFALGAVIYEMATGRRAFEGTSQASLIAAILERQPPPLEQVQPLAPAALDRIIRTCLAKDPDDRWQDAADVARQLTWLAAEVDPEHTSTVSGMTVRPMTTEATRGEARTRRSVGWPQLAIALGAIALAAYVATLALNRRQGAAAGAPTAATGVVHFAADVPGATLIGVRVSPDGRTLALLGIRRDGRRGIWVKRLDQPRAEEVPHLDGFSGLPAWSPDGRELAAMTSRGLIGVRLDGWLARSITSQSGFVPFSWGTAGTILEGSDTRLRALAGRTGEITVVQSRFSRDPAFLPDGRRFLYIGRKDGDEGNPDGVYLASLDAPDARRLLLPVRSSVAVDAGRLLFVRDGTLFAQPFDLDRGELTGDPSPIADGVFYFQPNGRASFHAAGGTIAYVIREPDDTLAWFDRAGAAGDTLGSPGLYSAMAIAPDGRRAVVSLQDRRLGTGDIFLFDLARGTTTRLTNDEFSEDELVWSPDGRSVAYGSDRQGPPDIYVVDVDSGAPPRMVYRTASVDYPYAWLSGDRLLVSVAGEGLRVIRLDGTVDKSVTHLPERRAVMRVSPDGRWFASQSTDTGRAEIYVQPFGRPGAATRVSIGGGVDAIWARDGRTLYFRQGRSLFEARVQTGEQFSAEAPRLLFSTDRDISMYDVTPDGRRFLVARRPPPDFLPVQVIVNWTKKLQ